MIDVMKIARESHIDVYALGRDYAKAKYTLERFASLHRAAVLKELMEGVGEPAVLDYDYGSDDLEPIYGYTASQVAAAVAKERERCRAIETKVREQDDALLRQCFEALQELWDNGGTPKTGAPFDAVTDLRKRLGEA